MSIGIPLFDAHCDTLTAVMEKGGSIFANHHQLDLHRLGAYAPAAQVFAVWGGRYTEKCALLKGSLAQDSGAVFCRSTDEIKAAAASGQTACLLSVEGAEQLDCSAPKLRAARLDDGLFMIGLCWNNDNALCGAAMDSGSGLTKLGKLFVLEAQELGVVVDLSHASERSFWDVLEISQRPVITSHSNSAAIYSRFPRNITDAQFSALIKCGGGTGLNLCPDFLGRDAGIDDCVAHVEHFLALGGERALFLGADLDGIDSMPRGIGGVQDLGKIYEALLRRNYSEDLVRDIFYNNLFSILERAT